ncbi:hypothetical protein NVV94_12210 [Pseudomonas sp. LS1212]|uniref:hypothetical protein n=1 Tax=Pseudomonas sp. LS1212 TaxID=2972478 RepID=UPI00215C0085|nr:hypothetical protein [Pseudomonas sp. LS1212]UVJ46228.1 hypothetical protein NVV94_12210 [Pseudomonas sp. LS1212]
MRFVRFMENSHKGLAVEEAGVLRGLLENEPGYPGSLHDLLTAGPTALKAAYRQLRDARLIDQAAITLLPPIERPSKIVCVGLNYADHTKESPYEQPAYPTFFPGLNLNRSRQRHRASACLRAARLRR